jgi:twitching motility protein PilT
VLRQDPDVILIGEMRDTETVEAALTAAQTGHFVMSTLHTIDAQETINRIIDFFPLHQQKQVRIMLAGTLKGIISQRLLVRADGQGRVPAVEIMIAPTASATSSSTRPGASIRRRHRRRLLRHADVRPGVAQAVRGRLDHAERRRCRERTPHDFKLLVQQQGHRQS